jgi:predicted nucleotidyltransferase
MVLILFETFKYNKVVNYNHKMDNKQKILLFLAKNYNKKYSILDVSKTLQIPYTTTLRSIKNMKNSLNTEIIGQTTAVSLNKENELNIAHLAIASVEEKKEYLKINNIIKLLTKEIRVKDIVLLFGSYAKNTQIEKSDIDLIIINEKGEKTINFHNQELIFNKKINPMYFTKEEFSEMLNDEEENVAKQALKNNIILNNPLKFWELVINETR